MNLGLSAEDFEDILKVLTQYPQVTQALIFGSRAKGNYKPGSDVDMALKGITTTIAWEIAAQLNQETLLPYHFDVLSYEELNSPELKEHIDRVGKVVYETQKA